MTSRLSGAETPPVLFMVFNRTDVTSAVFERIREAKPPRLYVAGDGPRADRAEAEADLCDRTRHIATAVDWDCAISTLFQDDNLGCRAGVTSALDWFFTHEEAGIILEDDCLPEPTFFRFAGELLDRYADDQRVGMVSGDYFAGDTFEPATSYSFSRNTHIWGWATWRRAWALNSPDLFDWPQVRPTDWLEGIVGPGRALKHWRGLFDRMHAGEIDTWDYAWTYSLWRAGALSAQATVNLVSNLGFGPEATHTADSQAWQSRMSTEPMRFPLVHPSEVRPDENRDAWTENYVFGIGRAGLRTRLGARLRGGR